MSERLVRLPDPYDFRASIASLSKSGLMWPVARWIDGTLYKATSTPNGPATLALTRHPEGVHAKAWGPGTDWALATGESFTGVTVMDTVATALPTWPSLTTKVKLSEPLKSASGV